MIILRPLQELDVVRFDTPELLRALTRASRVLAELKGMISSMPNHEILLNSLYLQEAKDSSAIENIVTTHDDLYQMSFLPQENGNPALKEIARYREALWLGYNSVKNSGLLNTSLILKIHEELESNRSGFRKVLGTALKDNLGQVIYTLPSPELIPGLMRDLEYVINQDDELPVDPLIKMALIHYQFESIHPFYDGNGRTGRILNILYLVAQDLLTSPVLYLSRYIIRNKFEYYALFRAVRERDAWEDWVLFFLNGVEIIARESIDIIWGIQAEIQRTIESLRDTISFYSPQLITSIFQHPYSRIEFLMEDLGVTRPTAAKYLDNLVTRGLLTKKKVGRTNYYMNDGLIRILTAETMQ